MVNALSKKRPVKTSVLPVSVLLGLTFMAGVTPKNLEAAKLVPQNAQLQIKETQNHLPKNVTRLSLGAALKPKVYAALSIHVEGFGECPLQLEASPNHLNCSLQKYDSHVNALTSLAAVFVNSNGINLPLSLEFEENILSAAKLYNEEGTRGARLSQLAAQGHTLSPHAEAYEYYTAKGQTGIEEHFTYLKNTLLDPKVQTRLSTTTSLSGVCAAGNWLNAAQTLGFDTIAGVVSYCLLSLPSGSVPQGDIPSDDATTTIEAACIAPGNCHATYPYAWYDATASNPATGATGAFDLKNATRPWRTDSRFRFQGASENPLWNASVSSGATAIVPGVGSLYCLAEKKPPSGTTYSRWQSETHCNFCENDIETYFEILDQTLAEATLFSPRVVYSVYSLGTAIDSIDSCTDSKSRSRKELLEIFTRRLQRDYVDTGRIQWTTVPDLGKALK